MYVFFVFRILFAVNNLKLWSLQYPPISINTFILLYVTFPYHSLVGCFWGMHTHYPEQQHPLRGRGVEPQGDHCNSLSHHSISQYHHY